MPANDSPPNPLAVPGDRRLLDEFRALCRLPSTGPLRQQLAELCGAFADVPYENLTKIVKYAASDSPAAARRAPHEVLQDFQRAGAGGTCFSLTAALLYLVRALPLPAQPILADRHYGTNTHCALVVWIEHEPHLLDPGYLIVSPLALRSLRTTRVVPTRFNELELVPSGEQRVELSTIAQGNRRYRLTFKTAPAGEQEFLAAWDASFGWDMMRYPVLTRVTGDEQVYLRSAQLQKRSRQAVRREAVASDQLAARIVAEFGIDRHLVESALAILARPAPRLSPG